MCFLLNQWLFGAGLTLAFCSPDCDFLVATVISVWPACDLDEEVLSKAGLVCRVHTHTPSLLFCWQIL